MTVRRPTSMRRVLGPRNFSISDALPTATMRSFLIASASAMVNRSSTVTILPLTSNVSAGSCVHPGVLHANASRAMRTPVKVRMSTSRGQDTDSGDWRTSELRVYYNRICYPGQVKHRAGIGSPACRYAHAGHSGGSGLHECHCDPATCSDEHDNPGWKFPNCEQ